MRESTRQFSDHSFQEGYVGDFDGNGQDDLVLHFGNSLQLYLSDGTDLVWTWASTGDLGFWDDVQQGDRFYVADFDGDGMDDLYVSNFDDWSIPYFGMLQSKGAGGFEIVRRFDLELPGWDDMRDHDEFFVGDYDGDGREDIAVFNGRDWSMGYLEILRSTGNNLVAVRRYDEELPGWDDMKPNDEFYVGDFDGDGRDDLYVVNLTDWSMGYLEMLRSTGSGLSYVRRYDEELPGWDDMRDRDEFYVGDFNGDGNDDLYVFNGFDWSMEYLIMLESRGGSLASVRRYDNDLPGWDELEPHDRFWVADTNDDGRDDLYVYNSRDWVTEYLGVLRSTGDSVVGSWQDDWIGLWNLGPNDQFVVADFHGSADYADLYVFNDEWFGLLASYGTSVGLDAIYRDWIHQYRYHDEGWW